MIASRELYNWDIQKMAVTRFDEEGFPGCWTAPGVGSLNLDTTFLEAAVDINKWDVTRKLVCKHLINEEAPPQIKSRLVYGTTGQPSQDNKGLLQVWDLDWNYWCDDVGKTSKQDLDAVANLACMEMGYAGFASIRGNQWTPNKMQDLVDEIFISEFDCLGAETSLFQCVYVKNNCIPNQAIEVTCSSEALTLDPTVDPTIVPTAAPTIYPTSNPTADPTAGFVQGPKTGCKTGTKQPTTAQECREVAIANGVRYWGGNGHSSGADPKGCIYRTPDKDIYFNTHSTGSTSRGDRRTVCVPIPQSFVQGPKTGCIPGTKQPTTAQECREVAIANGVRYWGGNGHSSGADPKGCIYRTPDKDIYFNTHSTGSTSRGDRRTVCVAIPQRACTEELCASRAAEMDLPFQSVHKSNGAPRGCVMYREGVAWVRNCVNHPNCGTTNCNGCEVIAACPAPDPIADNTYNPTLEPTINPTMAPTGDPSVNPTINPTVNPTINPSVNPTMNPSVNPTMNPSVNPTINPTASPTINPSVNPTMNP